MIQGLIGLLLFVFFVIVFILVLMGSTIIRAIRRVRKAMRDAADQQEMRYRTETGRRQNQYQFSHKSRQTTDRTQQSNRQEQQPNEARHTQTDTGTTIIDHHHAARENRKIFDDTDGEYVDFEESN